MASLAEKIATTNPELSSDFSNLNIQEKVKKMVDELHKVNFENYSDAWDFSTSDFYRLFH